MESQIAVLPATVIDQIAAGEVIERPASVVRELVDNAIDAGAKTISVETTAGGRGLIRIVDDGCGMSPKDAVLAFERHATSKLRAVDDLWGLPTLGFRGEALPSIASVSRITLTTRRQQDLAATRVQIEGGKLISVSEVGAPVGTCVEVTDLFYCVPARLKFLKGEGTEASHITDHVARIAMAHFALHLRLRHNGRVALDVPPDRDAFSRAQSLLGSRVASRMIPVSGEETGIRVTAFLGAPDLAQTTARGVQLFVGKRPVRDRGLLHALAMGYGELLPRGRYPLAIVLLEVPGGSLDINVHPQKAEVRFSDAAMVCAAVRHVVQAGVERAAWRNDQSGVMMTAIASIAPPRLPFDAPATSLAHTYAAQLRESREGGWAARDASSTQAQLGFDASPRMWAQSIKDRVRTSRAAEAELAARAAHAIAKVADADRPSRPQRLDDGAPLDDAQLAEGSAPTPTPGFFSTLRYLGQLDLTYLICEGDGELVLIDQHIAHERVELARLKALQSERDVVPTQRMLFPQTIDVKPELVELATKMAPVLAQVGYEAEGFGKHTLAVKAVPGGIRHGDPTLLLRELLTEWADEGTPTEAERLERVLAEIACHSVVRAGDRLSPSEAEALLRSMDGADFTTHGPHGRP
ncbi:MAG TPA: DNA mismatch repair endonuclease MutL, partial [Kofleriaceae bacterium]|nr:DNA mismatch repair endonuclease MutL [Kofleriaceae bacterium]